MAYRVTQLVAGAAVAFVAQDAGRKWLATSDSTSDLTPTQTPPPLPLASPAWEAWPLPQPPLQPHLSPDSTLDGSHSCSSSRATSTSAAAYQHSGSTESAPTPTSSTDSAPRRSSLFAGWGSWLTPSSLIQPALADNGSSSTAAHPRPGVSEPKAYDAAQIAPFSGTWKQTYRAQDAMDEFFKWVNPRTGHDTGVQSGVSADISDTALFGVNRIIQYAATWVNAFEVTTDESKGVLYFSIVSVVPWLKTAVHLTPLSPLVVAIAPVAVLLLQPTWDKAGWAESTLPRAGLEAVLGHGRADCHSQHGGYAPRGGADASETPSSVQELPGERELSQRPQFAGRQTRPSTVVDDSLAVAVCPPSLMPNGRPPVVCASRACAASNTRVYTHTHSITCDDHMHRRNPPPPLLQQDLDPPAASPHNTPSVAVSAPPSSTDGRTRTPHAPGTDAPPTSTHRPMYGRVEVVGPSQFKVHLRWDEPFKGWATDDLSITSLVAVPATPPQTPTAGGVAPSRGDGRAQGGLSASALVSQLLGTGWDPGARGADATQGVGGGRASSATVSAPGTALLLKCSAGGRRAACQLCVHNHSPQINDASLLTQHGSMLARASAEFAQQSVLLQSIQGNQNAPQNQQQQAFSAGALSEGSSEGKEPASCRGRGRGAASGDAHASTTHAAHPCLKLAPGSLWELSIPWVRAAGGAASPRMSAPTRWIVTARCRRAVALAARAVLIATGGDIPARRDGHQSNRRCVLAAACCRLVFLKKLVPHDAKANTASFLEEVIKYVESLKRRVVQLEGAVAQEAAAHLQRTMTERVKNACKASEAMDSKKAHIQAFIDRFRYNANRAALVQSRIKALERMPSLGPGGQSASGTCCAGCNDAPGLALSNLPLDLPSVCSASSFEEETKRASQGMGMGMGKGISQMDLLQAAGGLLLVGGDSTNVPLKKRKGPSPGGG
ncbi:MAG: hypothetical protein WDW38_002091 [Sanguina aurantia]